MVAHAASWVCLALSCLAFTGLAEGANLRAGSCDYNGNTYWEGQTIESLPDQCTELKCKWSADGNPTVQLVPIDGCSCTTVRALPTQHEDDLQLPLHAHTRQTKSQCLYNGQLKWGGAVLDRIDENCVKLVCKGVSGAQNYIETQVTAGCSCTQTTTTTTTESTSTTTPTTTTPTTTTPTTTTPTTTTPTTTTPTTTTPTTTTCDYNGNTYWGGQVRESGSRLRAVL
ncbi:uncharacterized protein [Penaeus vannamei]|uniref:uncharacterized protein n=1 Tax=Penaeus vannamei TaxID=6689 RepID=UPI00387F5905